MSQNRSILLVDDEQDFLDNLSLTLESAGYQTITATDGVEALQALQEHPVDLILSDVGMPRMGGYQLYQHIRKHPGWAEIPFIFLTGYEYLLESKRKAPGVRSYLIKPIRAAELIVAVDNTLHSSSPLLA